MTDGDAPDAFQALADGVRTGVLRELAPEGRPVERTFTELFEAADVDTSAGFAYHLRQLDGRFVRETDDGYALTYAGLSVARAIRAGEFTDSRDLGPVPVDEDCPLCDTDALALRIEDNVVAAGCGGCGREVLRLPHPPAAVGDRDAEAVPAAVDRYQRDRIAMAADGVCPDCGGVVDPSVTRPPERLAGDDGATSALADLPCTACGLELRVPVTLCVLDHPAVVAAFHEHGVDLRDRPLWHVGDEFSEAVIETDPWCVRVRVAFEDRRVDCYVDGEVTVRAVDAVDRDDDPGERAPTPEGLVDVPGDEVDQDAASSSESRSATADSG